MGCFVKTGTISRWGSRAYSDRHVISHAEMLDEKVRKGWKNGHRLELYQETVLLEEFVRFFSISSFASARLRKNQQMLHNSMGPDSPQSAWERGIVPGYASQELPTWG